MDPTIVVGILALGGTVATIAGSVFIAIYTTRRSANAAAEEVEKREKTEKEEILEARIVLRNEEIEALEKDVEELKEENVELRKEKVRLLSQIRELRDEVRIMKKMLDQLRKEKSNESRERHRK